MAPIVFPMLFVTIVSLGMGWIHFRWMRHLGRESEPISRQQLSFRELFVVLSTFCIVAALTTYLGRTKPPQYAEATDLPSCGTCKY